MRGWRQPKQQRPLQKLKVKTDEKNDENYNRISGWDKLFP